MAILCFKSLNWNPTWWKYIAFALYLLFAVGAMFLSALGGFVMGEEEIFNRIESEYEFTDDDAQGVRDDAFFKEFARDAPEIEAPEAEATEVDEPSAEVPETITTSEGTKYIVNTDNDVLFIIGKDGNVVAVDAEYQIDLDNMENADAKAITYEVGKEVFSADGTLLVNAEGELHVEPEVEVEASEEAEPEIVDVSTKGGFLFGMGVCSAFLAPVFPAWYYHKTKAENVPAFDKEEEEGTCKSTLERVKNKIRRNTFKSTYFPHVILLLIIISLFALDTYLDTIYERSSHIAATIAVIFVLINVTTSAVWCVKPEIFGYHQKQYEEMPGQFEDGWEGITIEAGGSQAGGSQAGGSQAGDMGGSVKDMDGSVKDMDGSVGIDDADDAQLRKGGAHERAERLHSKRRCLANDTERLRRRILQHLQMH